MKKTFKKIDGVLLLNKATGITSNRALQQVKRLLNAAKAGHTGSLDPLASGVLPICLGEATKFARFLLDADKTYEVSAKLGVVTDSGDATGNVISTHEVANYSNAEVLAHIAKFIGQGTQIPSMYSALKHNGQALYKLARRNITVERKPRPINIFAYDLLDFANDTLSCRIHCSKGTYVRTLIEDLGQSLGCGAHVTALHRIGAGPFTIQQSIDFASLAKRDNVEDLLLPPDVLLRDLPEVVLTVQQQQSVSNGQAISVHGVNTGEVRLLTENRQLVGIGQAQNDGNIVALRLVASPQSVI